MPRSARLDAAGVLHHIMIRGIERRNIFRDNPDRDDLLERLSSLLPETQTICYAWALIPNHAHFLFRSGPSGIASLMRRLLTGYAVSFNHRHNRSGQLFQNRYKSIVCQEDIYFKELIRYIHLNPIRARIIPLDDLNRYPYTGHSALMGTQKRPCVRGREGDVLQYFNNPHPHVHTFKLTAFLNTEPFLSVGEEPQSLLKVAFFIAFIHDLRMFARIFAGAFDKGWKRRYFIQSTIGTHDQIL